MLTPVAAHNKVQFPNYRAAFKLNELRERTFCKLSSLFDKLCTKHNMNHCKKLRCVSCLDYLIINQRKFVNKVIGGICITRQNKIFSHRTSFKSVVLRIVLCRKCLQIYYTCLQHLCHESLRNFDKYL